MARLPRVLDIEDAPDLKRIVEEVSESHVELVIRRNGKEIVVVAPVKPLARPTATHVITEADREATRSAAGGWADVDTDRLLRDIYADRDLGDRPPVDW